MYKDLKFDFRIYVLITGCNPLRVYLHRNGLVRFATESYQKASKSNKESPFIHLTNFAINKENPKYNNSSALSSKSKSSKTEKKNSEDRNLHKRSIKDFLKELSEDFGVKTEKIWEEIQDIVVKTICSIQPVLKHNYISNNSDDPYDQICFELLGFDILLDKKLKPFLLEVNHSPSFRVSSKVDFKVKRDLIYDTFKILNLNFKEKSKILGLLAKNAKNRSLTGRRVKFSDENLKSFCINERDMYCDMNRGGFDRLFPSKNQKKIEFFNAVISEAENVYHRFTGVGDVQRSKNFGKVEKIFENLEMKNRSFKDIERIYGVADYKKRILRDKKNFKKKGKNLEKLDNIKEINTEDSGLEEQETENHELEKVEDKEKLRKILSLKSKDATPKFSSLIGKKDLNGNMLNSGYNKNIGKKQPIPIGGSRELLKSLEKFTRKNSKKDEILDLENMIMEREKLLDSQIKRVSKKIENFERKVKLRIRSSRPILTQNYNPEGRPLTSNVGNNELGKKNFKITKNQNIAVFSKINSPSKKNNSSHNIENYNNNLQKKSRSYSTKRGGIKGRKKKKLDPYLAWDPFKSFDRTYKDRMRSLGIKIIGANQLKNR